MKLLPFKAHLTADLAVGALSLAAPWLLGFSGNARARNAFLGLGAISLLVDLLTQPDEMPTDAGDATAAGAYGSASLASPVEATLPQEA